MEASTTDCAIRKKLEGLIEAFPPYAGFDTTVSLRGVGRVAVSTKAGTSVSFCGDQGTMILHRCPRGDISIATSGKLGNIEGISRSNGQLQGFDELPPEVSQLINTLHERSNN